MLSKYAFMINKFIDSQSILALIPLLGRDGKINVVVNGL